MAYKIKSSIKRIKDLDFSKEVVIDKLTAKKEIVERQYAEYKRAWPTLPEKDIWERLNEFVLKDNIFAKAVPMALKSYEVKIVDGDIKELKADFIKHYPNFSKSPDSFVEGMIKQTLIKDLLINDLAKYWKVQATDNEAKATFERMYVAAEGLKSVREYINDPGTINWVKGLIIRDKTVNMLVSKVKYKIDWESIKKYNDEYKAKLAKEKK